jgi:hypothetical protein
VPAGRGILAFFFQSDDGNPGARPLAGAAEMVVIGKKSASGPKKSKKAVTYVIDCTKPVDDKIMEIASFEKFLVDKIKVDGLTGESRIRDLLIKGWGRDLIKDNEE